MVFIVLFSMYFIVEEMLDNILLLRDLLTNSNIEANKYFVNCKYLNFKSKIFILR